MVQSTSFGLSVGIENDLISAFLVEIDFILVEVNFDKERRNQVIFDADTKTKAGALNHIWCAEIYRSSDRTSTCRPSRIQTDLLTISYYVPRFRSSISYCGSRIKAKTTVLLPRKPSIPK